MLLGGKLFKSCGKNSVLSIIEEYFCEEWTRCIIKSNSCFIKKKINNNYITYPINLMPFFLSYKTSLLKFSQEGITSFEDEYNNVSIYLRKKFIIRYLKDQLRKFISRTLHTYFVFLKEYFIFTMVWTSLFDVYYLPMLYKQDIGGKQENLVKLGIAFVRRFNSLVNTYSIIRTIYSVTCKCERKIIIDMKEKSVFRVDLLDELIPLKYFSKIFSKV